MSVVISANLVKELREQTGAGMMDCKKALSETNGDIEAAIDWLRAKGLSKAAKKADRVTAEGLVAVSVSGTKGTVVEINSETDFVARNAQFQEFVSGVAALAVVNGQSVDAVKVAKLPSGETVDATLTNLIASIGENMTIRRIETLEVSQGVIGSYVHNQVVPGMGKIGVLVALESAADKAALEVLAKQIAMHIAATSPLALSADDLDASVLTREAAVLEEKARQSGKPENVISKIVESGLKSYSKEVCLLDQPFVMDTSKTVAEAVAAAGKELGSAVVLKGYARILLGEGIEKEQTDFAAEVAAAVG